MQTYAPMRKLARTSGAGLLWLCAAAALAQPALPPGGGARARQPLLDRTQLEQRTQAVGYLLEKSSAARQIEASGNAEALQRKAQAQASYREARQALDAGNLAEAARLLAETSTHILEGARLAAPAQVTTDKQRKDFDARLASVQALLMADLRILAEKQPGADAAHTGDAIQALITEAKGLADKGELAPGRALLDRAYLLARAAISSMRRGETLTRSVNFASTQEEYQYEIERNNTHRALLASLFAEAGSAPDAVRASEQEAAQLRGAAEARAAAGEHEAAVDQLEQSTRAYLRAIRGLGIVIPGAGAQ